MSDLTFITNEKGESLPTRFSDIIKDANGLTFVDLFAGLGGFHTALADLGHKCVFASEIDEELQKVYEKNFGIKPAGNIRKVPMQQIPEHDILCAGFPCQPFSKAGLQEGLGDKERGKLFYEILKIIHARTPKFIILENVPHIRKQNDGKTWEKIWKSLEDEGYELSSHNISPHHFGIPQIRLRTYIVGSRKGLNGFKWPEPFHNHKKTSIRSVLDNDPKGAIKVPTRTREVLNLWQEFLDIIPHDEELPKPIWAMEFGATYPYEKTTPHTTSVRELRKYHGAFGAHLAGETKKELYKYLPSHATRTDRKFPHWKIRMIKNNREFYQKHKRLLSVWTKKIMKFPSSYQKLEWNITGGSRKIRKYLVQVRPSGVRVKQLTTAPSLVAMNATQIPIITWQNRYMTPLECSRLQSMDVLKHLPEKRHKAYKALGNAVNVTVVKQIIKSLIGDEHYA